MNRLSALIDESESIAASDWWNQSEITRQVSALREALEKQREHFNAFLRLVKAYADRFLSDISEEIQQQSSLLASLERRLDMAKTLREEVVHLRRSYEVGTLDHIKKLRRTGV
jgi:hypothetical protein